MVRVDSSAYFFGALLLLTLPLNWLAAAAAAAVVHELCHIAVIYLVGGKVWGIRIGVGGAVMETEPLSRGRELLCALAGPVGSLLTMLLCRVFPRLAVCGCMQGLFNLLPVFPLDGGRALRCGLGLAAPKWADRISDWVERGTLTGILGLALAGSLVWHLGILPLLLALVLICKVILRKRPCKPSQFGVQ